MSHPMDEHDGSLRLEPPDDLARPLNYYATCECCGEEQNTNWMSWVYFKRRSMNVCYLCWPEVQAEADAESAENSRAGNVAMVCAFWVLWVWEQVKRVFQ